VHIVSIFSIRNVYRGRGLRGFGINPFNQPDVEAATIKYP